MSIINESKKNLIIEVVQNYYQVDVKKKIRKPEVVFARQVAKYMLRLFTNMTVKEVGREFNMGHEMTSYAVNQVNDRCKTDPDRRNQVIEIEEIIEKKISH